MSDKKKEAVSYHTKLVGVTFEGRQAIISTLKGDESIMVRREPENEHDKRAVAVDAMVGENWLPIGYIAQDKNEEVANTLDAGLAVNIALGSITGGKGGRSHGVNVKLDYTKVPKVAEKKAEEPKEDKVTKKQAVAVLKHLLKGLGGDVPDTSEDNTIKYHSNLLGKNIELQEVNGHKRLEGYLSGSKFPDQFYQEFDQSGISKAMAEKFGIDVEELLAMWKINSEASTSYGHAIHAALENYDRNFELGDKVKKVTKYKTKPDVLGPNKALNRNAFLKKIVEDFHISFGGDYIRFSEEFIWNKEFKLCGSIDRVKVVDFKNRIIRIQDFKTDADIHEKTYQLSTSPFYPMTQGTDPEMGKELLDKHWFQLSFYAFILTLAGWTVEGLDIYWVNPEKLVNGENPWEEYSRAPIDLTEQFTSK